MELVTLMFGTEEGELITGPALLRDGQLWLVSKWLDTPAGEPWRPAIAIRMPMDRIQYTPKSGHYEYLLSGSVPKAALNGQTSESLGIRFEVLAAPPFLVEPPTTH